MCIRDRYKKRAAVCGAPVGKDVLSNTHFSGIEQVGTAVIVAGNIPVIGIDPGQNAFGITAVKFEVKHGSAVIVVFCEITDDLSFTDGSAVGDSRCDLTVTDNRTVVVLDVYKRQE